MVEEATSLTLNTGDVYAEYRVDPVISKGASARQEVRAYSLYSRSIIVTSTSKCLDSDLAYSATGSSWSVSLVVPPYRRGRPVSANAAAQVEHVGVHCPSRGGFHQISVEGDFRPNPIGMVESLGSGVLESTCHP